MLLIKKVKACFGVKTKQDQVLCKSEVEAQGARNKKIETKKAPKAPFLFCTVYLSSLTTDNNRYQQITTARKL